MSCTAGHGVDLHTHNLTFHYGQSNMTMENPPYISLKKEGCHIRISIRGGFRKTDFSLPFPEGRPQDVALRCPNAGAGGAAVSNPALHPDPASMQVPTPLGHNSAVGVSGTLGKTWNRSKAVAFSLCLQICFRFSALVTC